MRYSIFLFPILLSQVSWCQTPIMSLSDLLMDKSETPIISAHRGGYYPEYPENSIAIFQHVRNSINAAVPVMFEIDIREDKTGKLWLLHDETLERTTSAKGNIAQYDSTKLSKITLKNQKGKKTSLKLTSLDEAIKWANDKNVYFMLDIKGDIWKKILHKINSSKLADKCIILTFSKSSSINASLLAEKSMISVLINDHIDLQVLDSMGTPSKLKAAYVTPKTTEIALSKIKEDGVIRLSDPRELYYGINQPMSIEKYTDMIHDFGLKILVTDFPIEVATGLDSLEQLKQKLSALHLKKFQWLIHKQLDSLNHLLHTDVYYIHSNGWKETKHQIIHNISTNKLKYNNIVIHDSQVRIIGNSGIVTGKGTFYVSLDETPIEINLYYTEVYIVQADGIKLISRHACKY